MDRLYSWNEEKNQTMRQTRAISFEEIVAHIAQGDPTDCQAASESGQVSRSASVLLRVADYVYVVPFIEKGDVTFLKTLFPSRKVTRQ